MFRSIVLLIILGFGAREVGLAQISSQCINKAQLLRLQYAELDDIQDFMEAEGWGFAGIRTNQILRLFEYPIRAEMVRWDKSYVLNGGSISLYSGIGTDNLVVYEINRDCFLAIRAGFKIKSEDMEVQRDLLVYRVQQDEIVIEFREAERLNSDKQYTILVYNADDVNGAIELERNKERQEQEVAAAKQKAFEETVASGDSLYKLKQYNAARLKYSEAQEMNPDYSLKSKIETCERAICQQFLDFGDEFLKKKQYDLALDAYNKAYVYSESRVFLESLGSYATRQIAQIRDIQNILNSRSNMIYSYKDLNPGSYGVLYNVIVKDLEREIDRNEKGYVDLTYKVAFDTLGFNSSGIASFSSNFKDYQNKISNEARSVNLSPSKVGGFNVASEDLITAKVNWETEKYRYLYNYNGLQSKGKVSSDLKTVSSDMMRESRPYGKYLIAVRKKQFNGSNFKDIYLIDFKTVGPEASFLSLLMPGMGTLAVTHGEKGWGRFTGFFISSALAIVAQIYSNDQYKKYELATTQSEIDKYYQSADISHKVSLAAAGISATIYIHDFFWVFSKGLKNKKQAKSLSKDLNNGPIPIQQQAIKFQ